MSMVYTGASMSLDGYISGPNDSGFDKLFKWYGNGDVTVTTATPDLTMTMTQVSADHVRGITANTGALLVGRKLFDNTSAWGGRHPMDMPVVVLTHRVPDGWPANGDSFSFVTDGVEAAGAQAQDKAGDGRVGVNSGQMAGQCLAAGLLDEVWVDLIPVVLGGGTTMFELFDGNAVELESVSITPGKDVIHHRFRVRKS